MKMTLEVDWNKAPEWANYLAWESTGKLTWFEERPIFQHKEDEEFMKIIGRDTKGRYRECSSIEGSCIERPRKWKIVSLGDSSWKVYNDDGEMAIFNNEETARRILAQWNGEEE